MNEFVTLTQAKAAKIRLEAECMKLLRKPMTEFQQDMGSIIESMSVKLIFNNVSDKNGHATQYLHSVKITVEL